MSHQKLLPLSIQLESNNWSLKGEHVQPGLYASKNKESATLNLPTSSGRSYISSESELNERKSELSFLL